MTMTHFSPIHLELMATPHYIDIALATTSGYPIEELAENSTYLEVAYLLIYGELPTPVRLKTRDFSLLLFAFFTQTDPNFSPF